MEAKVVLLEEWSFYFFFLLKLILNKESYVFPILKKKKKSKAEYKSLPAPKTAMWTLGF